MAENVRPRQLDVAGLPNVIFGPSSLVWWGTLGLIAIEGTIFAITIACYFFYRTRSTDWPPGFPPPKLLWGTLNLVVFLISALPNQWSKKAAERGDLRGTRLALLALIAVGVVNIALRVAEWHNINCSWDGNAYGSIVWMLLGLHTIHLLTDWSDSVVVVAALFRGELVEGHRFMDVSENAVYWYFVVLTWIPIWFVLYIAPRLL